MAAAIWGWVMQTICSFCRKVLEPKEHCYIAADRPAMCICMSCIRKANGHVAAEVRKSGFKEWWDR